MDWKIEATKPTKPSDLKSVLEAARDEWIVDHQQPEDSDSESWREQILEAHNEKRAPVVAKWRASVAKTNAAQLFPTFANMKRQMDAGIAAVVAYAGSMPTDSWVRATLSGHFKPEHPQYLDERVNFSVDLARPPIGV